ncbi:TlpA family protein disulfide reductase [Flavobacterium sp.]|uniref:TlpA family protein disulfide reductase n=1 Tax=Flavobacterium sp. TaxID=239 RepID=UPI003751A977
MKKLVYFLSLIFISSFGFAQGKVTFQANITNKNGDVIYIKDNMNKIVKEIKINPLGFFKDSFEVKDGFYQMYDGVEFASLYLKDGFDLQLTMDAKMFDESIVFKGKGEVENNLLAQNTIGLETFEAANFDKNKEDFAIAFESKKKSDIEKLEKGNFDEAFKTKVRRNLTQDFYGLQMAYKENQIKKEITGKVSNGFEYENHAGGKTKLEDLRGKYVYIDVWATWCGPCRAEIPFLKKVEAKYEGKKIEFVSISVDEDKDHAKWVKFVTEKQLGGIQLFADKNWLSDFIKSYGINSIPRFILLDPEGKVVSADADRPSDAKLVAQLDKLLN